MRTLAGSAIADARYTFRYAENAAPLKRNASPEEVGRAGPYLLSDMSSGVTGEIMHVDRGFHPIPNPPPQAGVPPPPEQYRRRRVGATAGWSGSATFTPRHQPPTTRT